MAPAHNKISPADTVVDRPSMLALTPVTRVPDSTSSCTRAWLSTARLLRVRTGSR